MIQIVGDALPQMPFEERASNDHSVLWRYSGNPVIARDGGVHANSVFNSAVVPFRDGFAGIFRVENLERVRFLHARLCPDGIRWHIASEPIVFSGGMTQDYGFDPRITRLEGKYYLTWCNGMNWEPTVGMAWTEDFRTFHQMENVFLPYNRNGVLFPRKIQGEYCMLSRPSDTGNTPFGNIYLSSSPDLIYWGRHREVMRPTRGWQRLKIGAGPAPLETDRGWLLIYHGVIQSCSGFLYSIGAALLDRENPSRVLARSKNLLMAPREIYELTGDVPNVVFPCGMLVDAASGRLALYYGAADTCVGLAFGNVEEIIDAIQAETEQEG